MNKTYIIIHGLNGSPEGHWQHILFENLKSHGENVLFPQFSKNSKPVLKNWLGELNSLINNIEGEKVIIAHSLGVILWFHYTNSYKIEEVSSLLLVAPPGNSALSSIKELNSFADINIDKDKFKKSAKKIRLVATENDSYCIENAINIYGKALNLDYDILSPDKGHINMKSGYGEWKSVYNWCFDSDSRLQD